MPETDPPTTTRTTKKAATTPAQYGGHASLAEALVAFQTEMPIVPKGKTAKVEMKSGGTYSYAYADLPDVSAAAIPILVRHGLSFSALPGRHPVDGTPIIRGILRHVSGEYDEADLPLHGRSAQEIGSSLTYARRYLLGCMTGVVTDEDDDGAHAHAVAVAAAPPYYGPTSQEILDLISQHAITLGQDLDTITRKFREQHGGVAVEALASAPPQLLAELEASISRYITEHPPATDPWAVPETPTTETTPDTGETPGPGASGEQPPS